MSQVPSLSGVAVVFDLDGTLVDTAPDIIGALNVLLAEAGLPTAPVEAGRRLIGGGVRRLLERGFAEAGAAFAGDTPDRVARFMEVYGARVARESRPYPGVEAALDSLLAEGARLTICTNKPTALADALLEQLGLRARFGAVVGADAVARGKPDPQHFQRAVADAGGDPCLSVMVGDSHTDVATGRAAGVPVVLVPFGYTETPAALLGADVVIGDFAELPAVVRRLSS
ncbi:phosphoglycolate phosphatase [Caulobacter sp. 17J80-11]|uniref:phosphoglycolate phosphatase n=1 Tax=Caulobacter sp. 17J80-11 TaxID=2763502 RepID=UPI0016536688|nr:phosphoglycolate phosphatase [Caulobacter sp. 17J80-11]